MQESKYQICVLGSASYDQYLIVDEFPQPGETVSATESFFKNGGKGANQAVASSRLNCKTCFAGQLGIEPKGLTENLKNEMQSSGLSLEYMRQLEDAQTGQALIMLNKEGQNSIIIIGGANTHFKNLTELPAHYKQAIENSNLLLLQKEIPIQINVLAAKYAKQHNKIVALDCGGRDEEIPNDLLSNLDFISPNETELSRIIGDIPEHQITHQFIKDKLLKNYPKLKVLLKLGSKGGRLIDQDKDISMDSVTGLNKSLLNEYKILDTTGAGDCFTAAFFVKYLEISKKVTDPKELFEKCMLFANSAAFLCITVMGAMPSMPKRELVYNFIEKHFKQYQ